MRIIYFLCALLVALCCALPATAATTSYPDQALTGGYQVGHFDDVYDLTASDMVVSFTYDGNGLVDDSGAHAWAELGIRSLSTSADFNPAKRITSYQYSLTTVPLYTDKDDQVGEVQVWSEGDTLYIKYIATGNRGLTETHLAVEDSLAEIPQKKGNPPPGKFEFSTHHKPAVTEFTYAIDLTKWPAGTPLYIAAHAKIGKENAWAFGDEFPGKKWATYFTVTPTPIYSEGSGVWLATDYDWTANTFDPDPVGSSSLDLDDKLILQNKAGVGEGGYTLPSIPPVPVNNHRFWWDRDGVDPWQNGETANTGGIYQIIISLHATSDTTGTAYMNIRGLDQGFETDGNWNTIELEPSGITFTGDMKHMQVFYGLYGYGATHAVQFSDIAVTQ